MNEQIVSALIGAVVGSVLTGIISHFSTNQQIKEARRQAQEARREAREAFVREQAWRLIQLISPFLTRYTLQQLKNQQTREELIGDLERAYKEFYMLGETTTVREILDTIDNYLRDCRNFSGEEAEMQRLERSRLEVRDRVTQIMSRYSTTQPL